MFAVSRRPSIIAIIAFAGLALGGLALRSGFTQEQDKPDPDTAAQVKDANAILQAVGGIGVVHIQTTMTMIGVTADSLAKDVYTTDQVKDLMNVAVNGMEHSKSFLQRVAETGLTEDDAKYIKSMIVVYSMVQKEARALSDFAETRKNDEAKAFSAARDRAIELLEELTGASRGKKGSPARPNRDRN